MKITLLYTVTLYLILTQLLSITIQQHLVHAAQLTSLNFANSECLGEMKDGPFRCVTMFATISQSLHQRESPQFSTTISSYQDESSGRTITLKTPVTIEAFFQNSSAIISFFNREIAYNKYEVYEPGDFCAVSFNFGLCRDAKTRPSDQATDYVLCCLDRSKRGDGGHCYRYDYNAKYEWHQSLITVQPSGGLVRVTHRGKTFEYPIESATGQYSIRNEGYANIVNELTQSYLPFTLLNYYHIVRDARDATTPVTDVSKWFTISRTTPQFRMTGEHWRATASCQDPIGTFATHDILEHTSDQYYVVRNQTVTKMLKMFGAQYPDSLQVVTSAQNPQHVAHLKAELTPELSVINLVVYNINIQEGD